MANLTTGADLYADALLLAGEPATNSQYASEVYAWLTVVERALVSGGQFGPSVLEPLDWSWARAYPRGVLQLMQPVNRDFTATASFTEGSAVVTLSGLASLPDLLDWRLTRSDVAARPLVVAQLPTSATAMTITLQAPWTGPTDSVTTWLAYPDTYRLPGDFVRGCSPLFVAGVDGMSGPMVLDVIDPAALERAYPTAATPAGLPECAARVTADRLRFSHYLDTSSVPRAVQVEFDYIRRPPPLAAGIVPLVPEAHRRVLSYGAAYLILDDKDDSAAQSLWTRFQAQYKALRDEELRGALRMSTRWGVIQPARSTGTGGLWYTDGGLPVYAW